ncbi:MAG: chorismate-binding protein [Moheibacter sp.]
MDFLEKLQTAIRDELAFVLYRKPSESLIWLLVQDDSGENEFLMHSFDSKIEKSISDKQPTQISLNNFNFNYDLKLNTIREFNSISEKKYQELVQNTIDEISKTQLSKVVISRIKVENNSSFQVLLSFKKLVQNHPDALVYLWHTPKETWMGATPELLLQENKAEIQTVSLAGTKLPEYDWTEKEFDEQKIVTNYITSELQGLMNLKIKGPETIQAGSFQHLKSYISADIPQRFSIKKLVRKLHPTPAVCGLPKNSAFHFILENEGYNRNFYTGFIGIKNKSNTDYFVNLRCTQLFQNQIWIYVGGGITAESVPEKEWIETELKSETILNSMIQNPKL